MRKKKKMTSSEINKKNLKPKKGVTPLTDKQREFVRLMTNGERITPTRAVMRVYNTDKPTRAGSIANSLKKNPKIQMALAAHSSLAEETIVKAIMDYGDSDKQWQRSLAVETSKWVHDKLHGKAVQQNVNINQNFTKHAEEKGQIYDL